MNEEKPPIVSFEIKPFGDEDPDVVIANAKRILNVAWASVVNCLNISEDFR